MSTGLKFVAGAIGGALLMGYLVYVRGFFVHHAFIIGFAGAGLVYWTLRAVDNLRNLR